MHHITQAEYEEFVLIVIAARNAFCLTPGGIVQFNELLQSLRSVSVSVWSRLRSHCRFFFTVQLTTIGGDRVLSSQSSVLSLLA